MHKSVFHLTRKQQVKLGVWALWQPAPKEHMHPRRYSEMSLIGVDYLTWTELGALTDAWGFSVKSALEGGDARRS